MKGSIATVLLTLGISSCISGQYYFIKQQKTWVDAQSYCREKYTDLATIDSMDDMDKLIQTVGQDSDTVWMGFYDDVNSWRWSFSRGSYYAVGQEDFRNWDFMEPNNAKSSQHCTTVDSFGLWEDDHCDNVYPVVCYSEKVLKWEQSSSYGFVYVTTAMTWTTAQSYCRQHYTDMASVRNNAENWAIQEVRSSYTGSVWIGLFRDAWISWSDGSPASFTYWNIEEPNNIFENANCAAVSLSYSGHWQDWPCNETFPFVCYKSVSLKKMVVKLTLIPNNLNLNNPGFMNSLLEQFKQRMEDMGVDDYVTLNWTKQPDGNVFHSD